MAMKRNDGKPEQANGMMLAELKHLKALMASKEKRIEALEKELRALKGTTTNTVSLAASSGPVIEVKPQLEAKPKA